jgi:hypothetical protein
MVNMNDKSKVINLCSYPVSWKRITLAGDEYLKAGATAYIVNSEIETQKDSGNAFIAGTDGLGSHAEIYIENPELREQFMFDNKEEKRTQLIVDEEKCKYILELKTPSSFKKNLKEAIVTNHEKMKIMEYARKVKLNDYDKIKELEEYCGIKF